jgi:kynureninase
LYFCGNSLGPLTRKSKQYVEEHLTSWGRKGVLGHWDSPYGRPYTTTEERASSIMADIVGAKPSEVVAMATLTANLHFMLMTFYRPNDTITTPKGQKTRHKIIYEAKAFPSDQYALASAVTLAGFDPLTSLIRLEPRQGKRTLETRDILDTLEREAATGELAMIMLGGVQYLTGQLFEIEKITRRAKELGIIVGWDLAHAFANVPLSLHDWGVDFAVWCTYKYGCSGPGGIGGLFVHERWSEMGMTTEMDQAEGSKGLSRPAGWWGHQKSTRFAMPDSFDATKGAAGWQLSNPSQLDICSLLGAMETLAQVLKLVNPETTLDLGSAEHAVKINSASKVGSGLIIPILRARSQRLTAYLEMLLLSTLPEDADVSIVTPSDPDARGSQLCVCIPDNKKLESEEESKPNGHSNGKHDVPLAVAETTRLGRVHKTLENKYGVICDVRHPDLLRLAPLAHYSTFTEVWELVSLLQKALSEDLKHSNV